MTLTAALWPRRFRGLEAVEARHFEVEPGTRLLGHCHWQARRTAGPTLLLVHGLEGSSDSHYMCGTAAKAWQQGFHVVRVNQRNCGGTEELTPTLYNSGLSGDVGGVLELLCAEGRGPVCLAGFSMGGNLVLKLGGERGMQVRGQLAALVAVSPSLDLPACAQALEARENRIYQWYFVRSLKRRLRRKAGLFPKRYCVTSLRHIRTLREFDAAYTAPDGGYRSAEEYYERASALRVLATIALPTLILHAQDDPLIPFGSVSTAALAQNPHIRLLAPHRGGHCAFLARPRSGETPYWAEHRVVEFCSRAIGLLDSQ